MSIEIKYIPLTFINTDDEILKQIKNTVLFSYLFQNFEETSLLHYLQSTQYGYTASSSVNGTHQLVRITDINSGNVDWKTVPFCDCTTEEKYLLKDDDILVARTGGTTGKSFIVNDAPKNAVFASYLIRLRLKEDVNLEFINIYLNSYAYWSQIIEMKSGSAMPNVNAEKLKTLKIPKLSFKEQNEFVAVFNNTDKNNKFSFLFNKVNDVESLYVNSKKNTNELTHQLDLVKQLRQSFLREAMQGKLVKSTNTKETGQQLLEKIKAEKAQLIADKKLKKEKLITPISEEEISFEIPKHWVWCRLGEIVELKSGNQYSYPLSKKGVMYVKVGDMNLKGNEYEISASSNYFEIEFVKSNDLIKIGSIIFPKRGGAIATNKRRAILKENILVDSNTMAAIPDKKINFKYFFHWFSTIDLSKLGNDAVIPQVNNKDLIPLVIALPPFHEQEQIVTKLEELLRFCDVLEQSIKESQGYNEMLLQQVLREALQGGTN